MSQTEASYKNHPIHSTIESLLDALKNEVFNDVQISGNESYSFSRDKVLAVTQTVKSLLRQTPATLVNIAALNQVQGGFQNALIEVNSFISNKNAGHLLNAATNLDSQVMPAAWSLPPRLAKGSSAAISTIAADLRESALATIQELDNEKVILSKRIEDLVELVEVQNTKLTNLSEVIAQQKADALAVTAQVQQEFAINETERNSNSAATIDHIKIAHEKYSTQVKIETEELITYLIAKRTDVTNLVQAIGNTGLTGNYQRIAENETSEANVWRYVTVILFVIGIAIATATFIKFLYEPFTPETAWAALIRLIYALAITSPAWYTAKESARHRSNADNAKQTELELAALGPFIELMPEDMKNTIREDLVKKYFGKDHSRHEVEIPIKVKDVKDMLIETIKAVKNK